MRYRHPPFGVTGPMALKITCPHCQRPLRLEEPYPLPGVERQCSCGRTLAITYPVGMMEQLRKKGVRFMEDDPPAPVRPSIPRPEPEVVRQTLVPEPKRSPTPSSRTGDVRRSFPPPADVSRPTEVTRPTEVDRRLPRSYEPTEVDGGTATGAVELSSIKAPPPRSKVVTRNKKKPPPRRWLRGLAAITMFFTVAALMGIGLVAGVFYYYSQDLPTVDHLQEYKPPTVTVVYDNKKQLMGEIYEKRRYVVGLDQMPKHLKNAFIAAEDAGFYEHDGVDYMGILRAVGRNAIEGRMAQGGSTITQQVAKNFLLTNEKKLSRKIREALLAWRIEDTFDKDHILYLYLNQIYLGSGAYGVEAAARVYFGRHAEDLTLGQAALIAGLPQRPSDYSPHLHFEKAKERQHYVLGQMLDKGFITKADSDAAYSEDLQADLVARRNEFLEKAPWFTEYIRRVLVEKYGFEKVYNEGLVVETTCDLDLQQVAQKAVEEGVRKTDQRSGWRGPAEHIEMAQIPAYTAELAEKNDTILEGTRYKAVVVAVQKKHVIVDLGEAKAIIPLAWSEWAFKSDPDRSSKGRRLEDFNKSLRSGDVVTVEITNRNFHDAAPFKDYTAAGEGPYFAARLFQASELQGALFSMRSSDGAVLSMVGGVDAYDSEFNRAIQAYRQVGSTFKPIVYAAAIATRRYTVATIIPDAPLVFKTVGPDLWKPENYGEDYLGDITLRRALAMSRNVVTIRVLDSIKLPVVVDMARKVGIVSKMDEDLSMGLGAASLTMPEMATAYTTFSTLGKKVDPHYINSVSDRDNNILEQWTQLEWPQAIDAGVAGVMTWLLQEVASNGTAAKAQGLGLHVAGKTGTTNDFRDAWFVGFTPGVTTAVWVGYDQPRSIGNSATGGTIALPIWMDYMRQAVPTASDRPFPTAPGLSWVGIDDKSGRAIKGGRSMPFLSGTAPAETDMEADQKTSQDLLTTEF